MFTEKKRNEHDGKQCDTGADALVQSLLAAGIDTIFANPGTTEMPIINALGRLGNVKVILCLHETVCSGAADGYGRMLRKPACMVVHLGVGLANATANLHNAKRASTPILVVVGDIATWHVDKDPLLASDIAGLAAFSSRFVRTCNSSPDHLSFAVNETLTAIRDYRAGESRIATLVVSHDMQRQVLASAWTAPNGIDSSQQREIGEQSLFEMARNVHDEVSDGKSTVANQMYACARELLRKRGSCAIVVGGTGLTDETAFSALKEIQTLTSCQLLVENAFPRVERGTGRPNWRRIPYFPADAQRCFRTFDTVILFGVRRPVAMFGYDDGISDVILPTASCLQIDTMDVPGKTLPQNTHVFADFRNDSTFALVLARVMHVHIHRPRTGALLHLSETMRMMCNEPGIKRERMDPSATAIPCENTFEPSNQGPRLNAHGICIALACLQPRGAIVVDESITTGGTYWDASRLSKPFSHLTITGGSIGCGPPLAIGCAIACPCSRVINFQADGSALYSTPAFWTQAAEVLNITTIICANSRYEILNLELQKQGLSSTNMTQRLTSISGPIINWVALARGYGIDGIRVDTTTALESALLRSFSTHGPFLIEACC